MRLKHFLVPACLFLFYFSVVFPMIAPSVAPQGDSGELVTAAYTLGIPHPPGYPLYVLIGHLFTKLPFNSVAWRVNFSSAIFHSLALVFVYLSLRKITKSSRAAVFAVLALGFSYTFWLYSLVAEVFPLNNLFAAIIIFLGVEIFYEARISKIWAKSLWLTLVMGFAAAHHQTIVLIYPPLFFLLWPRMKQLWERTPGWTVKGIKFLTAGLVFLVGFTPYLFFLWRAQSPLPIAWTYPENLKDLWKLFIREDYGTFQSILGKDPALVTLAAKKEQIITYFKFVWDDFSLTGLLLILCGGVIGLRKFRKVTLFLLMGFLFSGVFFLSYANFPVDERSGTGLEVAERFYLLPNIFLVFSLAFLAAFFSRLLRNVLALRFLILPLLISWVVSLSVSNYSLVNQAGNFLALKFGQDLLSTLPPKSVLFVQGDIPVSVIFYNRYVERFRPDVELVTPNMTHPKNNYYFLRKVRPELAFGTGVASHSGFLWENYEKVPLAVVGYPGFSVKPLVASPSGFLFHFYQQRELLSSSSWKLENENTLKSYHLSSLNESKTRQTVGDYAVMTQYAEMLSNLGYYCWQFRDSDCAVSYLRRSLELDPNRSKSIYLLGLISKESGLCKEAEEFFLRIIKVNKDHPLIYQHLYELARDCFKDDARILFYQERLDMFKEKEKDFLRTL